MAEATGCLEKVEMGVSGPEKIIKVIDL